MKTNRALAAILSLTLLTACVPPGQSRYNTAAVGQMAMVQFGTVVAERPVDITGANSGIGALAGAGGGALAGSYIGRGGGSLAGLMAGALIGGLAGAATEQAIRDRKGVEYTITLESGMTMSIAQNIAQDDRPIEVGRRVMVQMGAGYQRVLPAEDMPTRVKRPKGIKVED